jgi:non-ribosomal peptide synthetase component F
LNTTLNTSVTYARDATNVGHGIKSKLYIVNKDDPDSLAPIGYVGEVLAEGPLLSREYLHDPAKTKARFIEYPR